jgi:hypothetical protein
MHCLVCLVAAEEKEEEERVKAVQEAQKMKGGGNARFLRGGAGGPPVAMGMPGMMGGGMPDLKALKVRLHLVPVLAPTAPTPSVPLCVGSERKARQGSGCR